MRAPGIADYFTLLDTQFITPHLASLGAVEIPKSAYRARLAEAIGRPATFHPWGERGAVEGAVALRTVAEAQRLRPP